jgi:ubiquinone/menaquinone biosynthesis C-methylase UbiE
MKAGVLRLHSRFYDSVPSWVNGTTRFASSVRKYLAPHMTVLNLGCGPGAGLIHFDREVYSMVGLDPDSAIAFNQRLTHRVRGIAEALPFRGEAFDLVYMDWVVEHLPSPNQTVGEVFRVLKPNGRLLFRTGNLFHYSYAVASFTPHWFHKVFLNGNNHRDPYPTYYRMNTVRSVRRAMEAAGFVEDELSMMEPDPAYVCMNRPAFLAGVAYERLVNRFEILGPMRANILACFRKPACQSRGSRYIGDVSSAT